MKYRIVQIGDDRFCPQYKSWPFWMNYTKHYCDFSFKLVLASEQEAMDFIKEDHARDKKKEEDNKKYPIIGQEFEL